MVARRASASVLIYVQWMGVGHERPTSDVHNPGIALCTLGGPAPLLRRTQPWSFLHLQPSTWQGLLKFSFC